jgi:PKD repeat protein
VTRQRIRSDEERWPDGRRPGILPGRRFALVLALAMAALGCWSGVAAADNSGQEVEAIVLGSSPRTETLSLGTLEQRGCPLYTGPNIEEYGPGGTPGPSQQITSEAWSLYQVLQCMGTLGTPPDPIQIGPDTQVYVTGTDGSPEAPLDEADLITPSDFANPAEAPLIYSNQEQIFYDRPWRGGTDDNSQDQVVDANPTPFVFEVSQGPIIDATATASANPVTIGTTVTFGVSVLSGNSSGLSYLWNFDGGAPNSTGQDPEVTFESAGTYHVNVQIMDASGNIDGDPTITITVAEKSASQAPTGKGPSSGPKHSRGATIGGTPGKHRVKGTTGPGKKHGAKQASTGKHARRSGAHDTGAAASTGSGKTPGSSQNTHRSGSSSPGSTAAAKHRSTARARRAARNAAKHVKHRSPAPVPAGPLVAGRLISDVRPLPAAESPLVRVVPAGLATSPALRRPPGSSLVPSLAAGLAILVLLSLGAGRELRWRRDWRPLRFGR